MAANREDVQTCPACGFESKQVGLACVKNFVRQDLQSQITGSRFYICLNPDCWVTYFAPESGIRFSLDQLQTPIAFKSGAEPRYICYCNRVTIERVESALRQGLAQNMQDLIRLTGVMKNANCQVNNPLGVCCSSQIKQVIERELGD